MRLQLIRTFLAVAEAGSSATAAHELRYSESSVAYHIRDLEKTLGVRLFMKVGGGLRLTEAGAALLDPAGDLVRTAERMTEIVRALAGGRGHVAAPARNAGAVTAAVPSAVPAQRLAGCERSRSVEPVSAERRRHGESR